MNYNDKRRLIDDETGSPFIINAIIRSWRESNIQWNTGIHRTLLHTTRGRSRTTTIRTTGLQHANNRNRRMRTIPQTRNQQLRQIQSSNEGLKKNERI